MIHITQTESYLNELRNLVEPEDVLKRHGYITEPLSDEELLLKRRCLRCGKAMSQLKSKRTTHPEHSKPTATVNERLASIAPLVQLSSDQPLLPVGPSLNVSDSRSRDKDELVPAAGFRCRYHPGQAVHKHWTCCSQHVTAKPCAGSDVHSLRQENLGELAKQHQCHSTPDILSLGDDVRAAVALDCEMGTAASGDSELIRLTLIDYFSGAILINNIVEPEVSMQHLNTRFSGVTWADIRTAKRAGTCLKGKAGARAALWRYVKPGTIVIGHGASNDLRALRWIHRYVVDSYVTEFGAMKKEEAERGDALGLQTVELCERKHRPETAERGALTGLDMHKGSPVVRVPGGILNDCGSDVATKMQKKTSRSRPGNLSLKSLVKRRLDREIQTGGKLGHDSLEDANAARDLVHWIVTHGDCE